MYYVTYTSKNGNNETRAFDTQVEALLFYRENMRNMAYGYIADDEANRSGIGEECMQMAAEEIERRNAEPIGTAADYINWRNVGVGAI